jgi:hypothetical protein
VLGEWHLDGDVSDISGNGNLGSLIGAAVYTTGILGQGVGLSGDGSYVNVPESPTLMDGSSGLTVSVWINMNHLPKQNVYYAPVAKEHSYRFIIGADGGAHFVVATSNNGWYSQGTVASFKSRLSAGVWYHLVGSYNGMNLQVYLNGTPSGTGSSISGTICAHAKPMNRHTSVINSAVTFGAKTAGNLDYTDGIIDEVRIYNRALSAEEILELYNSKK